MANYVQTIMDPMAGSPETPNAAKSAREWAALLTKNSQQPVHHWAQGIANMFNSALGGYTDYKANEAERMGQQKSVEQLLAALNPTATNTPIQQPQQPQLTPNAAPQDKFNWPNPPQTDPMFAGFGQNPESTAVPVPRGMRNNNPGNIIDSPFAKAMPGYIGSDGRFAKFASLDDGNAAMDRLLQSYGNRGLNTPEGIINRWAPPSDNNPTQAYAAKVARQLGVQPNATIDMNSPQVRQQLAQAITLQENGPRTQGLAPPAVPVSAAPPASAGVVPPGATPPIDRQALAQILTNPWASDATKQAVMQQLMPKSPLIVKEGDQVLNPVTLQPLYKNEKVENKWDRVGTDQFGNPQYGWVTPNAKRVEAQTVPAPQAQVQPQQTPTQTAPQTTNPQQRPEITDPNDPNYPNIRPVPQNANPKEWYDAETKRVAAIRNNRPSQVQGAEIVTQDIGRALDLIAKNPSATGSLSNITKHIGDTKAGNLNSLLNSVKSNIGFDKLQAMRAASPTGGALGAVSDRENEMLQSAFGSLEQSQGPQQLSYNLRRISNIYNDIIHGKGNGPQRFDLEGNNNSAAPVQVKTIQDAMKLPKGTRFIDPNGQERIVP